MASNDNQQALNGVHLVEATPVKADIADLVGLLRRRWYFVVLGTLMGMSAAVFAVSNMKPSYTANARIVFERTIAKYLQSNRIVDGPSVDDADTWGQVYIISSESNVLPVVRSLELANDPEFNGTVDEKDLKARVLASVRSALRQFRGAGQPDQPADPEKVALENVLRHLSVSRGDVPSLINVTFKSQDPVKAARIANAIVDAYQEANIASKMSSTKIVGRLAEDRVADLKQKAADAERALLEYKAANNVIGNGSNGPTSEMLTNLNSSLAQARVAMADAKARIDRVKAGGELGGPYAPDNELISRLRTQYLELASRLKDIEGRVGRNHGVPAKMRSRMAEVRDAIAGEQERLAGLVAKEYDVARARYEELTATISQVVVEEGANSGVQTRIRELEGAAETLRTLYARTLQSVSEAHKYFDADVSRMPDARIVTRATPPTQTDNTKLRFLIMAGGSMLGLLFGGALILAKDFPFGVFRTAQQVSLATGLECAVLPKIERERQKAALTVGEYALDIPYSRFAESLRSIWALINNAQVQSGAKVVCVVSSVPGEGKTTVATNLASHFSCHTSARVLVIDADFHRHAMTDQLAPGAKTGLKEALDFPADFAKHVVRKERLQLDLLPCPSAHRLPNAAELLGKASMQELIETLRGHYDLIVIEAAPIAVVVDFKIVSRHCDAFVFVVEWGKTSQRVVLECLGEASELMDRVLCVVLNKFDPRALKSVERYKGRRVNDYYSDQMAA